MSTLEVGCSELRRPPPRPDVFVGFELVELMSDCCDVCRSR